MNKKLLKRSIIAFTVTCWSILTSHAQGTYGAVNYFNFKYSSLADWTAFPAAASFKTVVDGDTLNFTGCNDLGATRAKGGFTGAVRCTAIELPYYESLGYLSFYVQNGSSGTIRNIYLKVWDATTATWTTVETIPVGGSGDVKIVGNSVLSKKGVKVKIDSDGKYFWFYNIEAWSSKLATTDVTAKPSILSVSPVAGNTITSSGMIKVQYDEIVKAGTATISFSGATVTPSFVGSTLLVNYSNLNKASDTLLIPANSVVNLAAISPAADTSFVYLNDIADPQYVSASPITGSNIHVNDLGGKITLTFNENIAIGTGAITFGPATVTPVVSSATLVIGYAGLAYNSAYKLTIPAGYIKDISNNTLKTALEIDYITNKRDSLAPVLLSNSISSNVLPIGGSINFTFNEIVKKSGEVTLNGKVMPLSFNGGMVGMNYTNLEYDTKYTLVMPAGAIQDTVGNVFPGNTFTFTTASLVAKKFNYVVAKDGSGDFTTIQAAVNAVTDNSVSRTLIFIKNGTYTEKVLIPATKVNLSLIGQDSAKVIVAFADYGGLTGTDGSYTFNVKAAGFYAENITFKNTWATTGGSTNQAVALMTEGDMQVFKNCKALGFQDTHYPKQPNTRNYYLNCLVEGATDFMFGGATAYYEGCKINCVNGGQYITAPSGTTKEFGLVYNNCTISANSNVAAQVYFLGRPWKDFGKTVWINTKMGPHIKNIGWAVWTSTGDDADNHLTGYYGEYNSMNFAGLNISDTIKRAVWGKKLTKTESLRYDIDNVFNYGVGANTWNPLPFATAPSAPLNVSLVNNTLIWDASSFAVGYLLFKNDTMFASTSDLNFVLNGSSKSTDVFKVKAINEYGAQSGLSSVVSGINESLVNISQNIYPNPFSDVVNIKNSDELASVAFYSAEGLLVKKLGAAANIDTKDLTNGCYILKITAKDGSTSNSKLVKY